MVPFKLQNVLPHTKMAGRDKNGRTNSRTICQQNRIAFSQGLDLNKFNAMEDMFHIQVKDQIFGEDWLECFATEILDAKYEKTDVAEVVKGLTHLNAHQTPNLLQVLQENGKMFNGTLGVYPQKRYTLILIQMPRLCILGHTLYLEFI